MTWSDDMIGLTVSMPNGEDATTPQPDLPFLFDYSLPPPFEQWIFPMIPTETGTPDHMDRVNVQSSQPAQGGNDLTFDNASGGEAEAAQSNIFMTDPNEAAAYLNLLASLQASEAFPGASQF